MKRSWWLIVPFNKAVYFLAGGSETVTRGALTWMSQEVSKWLVSGL